MEKMEQMGQEGSNESRSEISPSRPLRVEINGVLETFTSKAEYIKFLQDQLNEQQ